MSALQIYRKVAGAVLAAGLAVTPVCDYSSAADAKTDLSFLAEVMNERQVNAVKDYLNGKLKLESDSDVPNMRIMHVPGSGMSYLGITECSLHHFCNIEYDVENEQGRLHLKLPEGAELEKIEVFIEQSMKCTHLQDIAKRLNEYARWTSYGVVRNTNEDKRGGMKPTNECAYFVIYKIKGKPSGVNAV